MAEMKKVYDDLIIINLYQIYLCLTLTYFEFQDLFLDTEFPWIVVAL